MISTESNPRTTIEAAEFIEKSCAAVEAKVAHTAADLEWVTTRLVHHVLRNDSHLTRKAVFHPRTIDTFVTAGLLTMTSASRGNIRSILLRMSEVLLGEKAPRVLLTPIASSHPSAPYTDVETTAIRKWTARAQDDRRENAGVLTALGFGAGLSGGEIAEVRVCDLTVDDTSVTVTVRGTRTRTVSVDPAWAPLLIEAATDRNGETYLFCEKRENVSKSLVNNFIARTTGRVPGPNSQRMRATWIVAHLDNATAPARLIEQAGVLTLSALGRFMPFAKAA